MNWPTSYDRPALERILNRAAERINRDLVGHRRDCMTAGAIEVIVMDEGRLALNRGELRSGPTGTVVDLGEDGLTIGLVFGARRFYLTYLYI